MPRRPKKERLTVCPHCGLHVYEIEQAVKQGDGRLAHKRCVDQTLEALRELRSSFYGKPGVQS